MHWYDWLLIVVLLLFVYKRAEGYSTIYSKNSSLDSDYIPGGRPAEIFTDLSPSEWEEKDVSYVHTSNKVSCDS